MSIKKTISGSVLTICLLIGLPIFGTILSGKPFKGHLEFPPETYFIQHSSFSWTAFIILSVLILILILLVSVIIIKHIRFSGIKLLKYKIPWWGKTGLFCMILFWVLAWDRSDIFAWFRPHTFFPLWFSYILVINAAIYCIKGTCLLTGQTVKFLILFPASILFWWYFEYLNTFVRNWSYTAGAYTGFKYLMLSSIAFSTVLPAVTGTCDLINCFITEKKDTGANATGSHTKLVAVILLVISSAGLLCLGIFPDHLFPLVWVSPLFIILSIRELFGERTILSGITGGNCGWSIPLSASLSALFCGFFWEMWNYFSVVKWEYSIPFVNDFRIFEMPVLGYAGYIPFGILCVVIAGTAGIVLERDTVIN